MDPNPLFSRQIPDPDPHKNKMDPKHQCFGSESVGSVGFWLPGSGSAKICRSTDPDQPKLQKNPNPNV